MPSELEEVIRKREGQAVGQRTQKQRKGTTPPELKPGDLQVPQGVFKEVPDTPLKQIRQEDIRQDAQGIVLMDNISAMPYIKHSQPISTRGLALLIFNADGPGYIGLGEKVRFPAKCTTTDEPVIASALLLQLGQVEVTRATPAHVPQLDETEHIVARLVAYRDELPMEWATFMHQPVKHLINKVACLQPRGEDRDHILEVWDRQTLTAKLTRTQAPQADIFVVNIRVKGNWTPQTFEGIDDPGIYLEPRTEDGRAPHPAFCILWMAKKTKAEVQTAGQATKHWTTLARTGDKWGLRASAEAAEALHAQHRPGTPYLPGGKLEHYHVGPVPFGTTRQALTKIFTHWEWPARPVHPLTRAADGSGCVWLVQAPQEPQSSVWSLAHGDVIVTKASRPNEAQPDKTQEVIMGKKTKEALAHQPSKATQSEVDPWLEQDPWQTPLKTARTGIANMAPKRGDLQAEIERQINQAIRTHQDNLMRPGQGKEDGRLEALEKKVGSLEQGLAKQQAQTNTISDQIGHVQQQVATHALQAQQQLDQRFAEQLAHIDALLNKRGRHE